MALTYPKQIRLCEVGLRDGLQNEKKIPTTQEKIAYVNALTEAGFPVIEVGSFVSPKAVPQVADTDEVFKGITQKPGVEYRALIANLKGVDRAIECGCKKVKLNVSASVAQPGQPELHPGRKRSPLLRLCGPGQGSRHRNLRFHLHGLWLPLGQGNCPRGGLQDY